MSSTPPAARAYSVSPCPMHDVTLLLQKIGHGDRCATDQLLPLVYDELRKLAAAKLRREVCAQTLQPTALVHEAWLRLGADHQPAWQNRAHFFGAAAEAMRRILIDAARRRKAGRRGGGAQRVELDEVADAIAAPETDAEVLEIHEVLDRLAAVEPRKAQLVKLRYFAGLSAEQAADVLGVGIATANRDWAYARAWLYDEIRRTRG